MMRDYKSELERVYESTLKGARCARCGRAISEEDRGWYKSILASPEKFFERHGVKPIKTAAFVCGRCSHEIQDSGEYGSIEKEIFAQKAPDFETTVRKELEDRDILPLLSVIQNRIVDTTDEFCVRDILSYNGYVCPYSTGKKKEKPTHTQCNECLRLWLRSTSGKFIFR